MVSFTYLASSIELPNPLLGDEEGIDLRFVYKRMMNGTVRSYKLGQPITVLELQFRNLNRPKIIEVIDFMRDKTDKLLDYVDYRGVTWRGHIMNFPFDSTHAAVRDNELRIVFEGYNV